MYWYSNIDIFVLLGIPVVIVAVSAGIRHEGYGTATQ